MIFNRVKYAPSLICTCHEISDTRHPWEQFTRPGRCYGEISLCFVVPGQNSINQDPIIYYRAQLGQGSPGKTLSNVPGTSVIEILYILLLLLTKHKRKLTELKQMKVILFLKRNWEKLIVEQNVKFFTFTLWFCHC